MKYILAFLLLVGCVSTPPASPPPGQYIEEVPIELVTPAPVIVQEDVFITETDVRMCTDNPDSPWCVIECEKHDEAWCK